MRSSWIGTAWLAGMLVIVAGEPSGARPPVCIADFPELITQEISIPLGCELVECCPGCPLDGSLDLRVRIASEAVAGAELRIRSQDDAEDRLISVPRGETLVPSVASPLGAYPPPLASIRLELDQAALARWSERRPLPDTGAELGDVMVEVEQLLGQIVVNEFAVQWELRQCADPEPCDRVVQVQNRTGDKSVILLDARRGPAPGGCTNDEIHRSDGTAFVGDLIPNDGCTSEVAVFSSSDAMAIEEDVEAWTAGCGDTLTIDLDPILVAPVTFFLAVPEWLSKIVWGKSVDQVAMEDFANANQIYDENKTGMSFDMDKEFPKWKDLLFVLPDVLLGALQYGFNPLSFICGATKDLEAHKYYVPDRLNVYYLPVPGGGLICPDNRNIIFIAMGKKPATLAHEFSHSLSLLGDGGHTNGLVGFDNQNVMWVREGTVRDHFSLGQAFRQNTEMISTINKNKVRNGPERQCPLLIESPSCPPLWLDWTRP